MNAKRYTLKIFALRTRDALNVEYTVWLTKKELAIQIDALKLAGFDSITAIEI